MRLAFYLAAAAAAFGQDSPTRVSGPVLGAAFDSRSMNLRTVLGVPGVAALGPLLRPTEQFLAGAVSPAQTYALVAHRETGTVHIVDLRLDAVPSRLLPGAIDAPDLIAISPDSRAAALFRHRDSRLQILAGLPDEATPVLDWTAPAEIGPVASLAVSHRGAALLAADLLVAVNPEGAMLRLSDGPVSAVAFLGATGDAAVADSRNRQVFLLRDAAGAASKLPLMSEQEGLRNPQALAYSIDTSRLLVADRDASATFVLDLRDNSRAALASPWPPAALLPMRGRGVFFVPGEDNRSSTLIELRPDLSRLSLVLPLPQ